METPTTDPAGRAVSTAAAPAPPRPARPSPTRCSTCSPTAACGPPPARSPNGPASRSGRCTSTSTTSRICSASPRKRHLARLAPMLTPVPPNGAAAGAGARVGAPTHRDLHAKTAGGRARDPPARRAVADPRPHHARRPRPLAAPTSSGSSPRSSTGSGRTAARAPLRVLDILTGPDAWQTLRDRSDLTIEAATKCVVDSIVLHLRAGGRMTRDPRALARSAGLAVLPLALMLLAVKLAPGWRIPLGIYVDGAIQGLLLGLDRTRIRDRLPRQPDHQLRRRRPRRRAREPRVPAVGVAWAGTSTSRSRSVSSARSCSASSSSSCSCASSSRRRRLILTVVTIGVTDLLVALGIFLPAVARDTVEQPVTRRSSTRRSRSRARCSTATTSWS